MWIPQDQRSDRGETDRICCDIVIRDLFTKSVMWSLVAGDQCVTLFVCLRVSAFVVFWFVCDTGAVHSGFGHGSLKCCCPHTDSH